MSISIVMFPEQDLTGTYGMPLRGRNVQARLGRWRWNGWFIRMAHVPGVLPTCLGTGVRSQDAALPPKATVDPRNIPIQISDAGRPQALRHAGPEGEKRGAQQVHTKYRVSTLFIVYGKSYKDSFLFCCRQFDHPRHRVVCFLLLNFPPCLAASKQKGLLFGRKHSRSLALDPTHRMFGLPRRSETFQPMAPSHHTRKNIPGPLFGIHRSRCLGFSFPRCFYVDPGGLGHLSCCRQACFRLLGTDDPYHLFFTLIGFRCQAVGAGRQLFVS